MSKNRKNPPRPAIRDKLSQWGVEHQGWDAELADGRDRYTIWDKDLPCLGLRLSLPKPGEKPRKVWVAMGRVDGRAVMETLDTLGRIPKLVDARAQARKAFNKMESGTSPLEERRADKARRAAEAEAAAAKAREDEEGKFAAVVARFLAEGKGKKGKTWSASYAYEFGRIVKHDLLPVWADKPIRTITRGDVEKLLDAKAAKRERSRKGTEGGAAVQANRTLTRLRRLFAWAKAKELVDADPTAGVSVKAWETSRDRFLDEDEIVWFWRAAERVGDPWGPIFQLLLLTGQRESQVSGAKWSEINLEKQLWLVPANRMKGGKPHEIDLSDAAVNILGNVPRQGALVFPTSTGNAISSFSRAKERLDAAMTAQKREATGDHEAEIEPWRLHDLRRTVATLMAEKLEIDIVVADKILAHSGGETIKGIPLTIEPQRV